MKALVFEPQFVGHNLAYARHLIEALSHVGVESIFLTSRQALDSDEYRTHLGTLNCEFTVKASDAFESKKSSRGVRVQGPRGLYSTMRALLDGHKEYEPEHVYVPFGNALAYSLGVPNPVSRLIRSRGVEIEAILLFGKYSYPHTDWSSRWKQELALRMLDLGPWTRIHHILPHAVRVMSQHSAKLEQITGLLPDPIETPIRFERTSACKRLGLNPDHRYLSLLGVIDRRKGIHDLLAAIRCVESQLPENVRFLIAGRCAADVRSVFQGEYKDLVDRERIVIRDQHLSHEELWAACYASTMMLLPYPEHQYSASILIRAAAADVPVVCNAIGWMQETTQRFNLGWTCNTRNPAEFGQVLVETVSACDKHLGSQGAQDFVSFHSLDNFRARITQRIRQRISGNSKLANVVKSA
jgi:glycosyltransferase involved in cell wall biosynthesis